jgi:hypothetical protein
MMTVDEEVWDPPEGQMAANDIPLVSGTDRKVCHPAYFKQGHPTLLDGGVPHGYKLSVVRFTIQQEQNPVRAEVQRIGFAGRRGRLLILPVDEFVGTASPDGKPHIDTAITLSDWRRWLNKFVHSRVRGKRGRCRIVDQRPEDSVDKVCAHSEITICYGFETKSHS